MTKCRQNVTRCAREVVARYPQMSVQQAAPTDIFLIWLSAVSQRYSHRTRNNPFLRRL